VRSFLKPEVPVALDVLFPKQGRNVVQQLQFRLHPCPVVAINRLSKDNESNF
jgi:hypothetical protein